jgi:hypothetical protein
MIIGRYDGLSGSSVVVKSIGILSSNNPGISLKSICARFWNSWTTLPLLQCQSHRFCDVCHRSVQPPTADVLLGH